MSMLAVGDPAPDFDLPAHPAGRVKRSDFLGKQNVILAWYPKDDTPGCTREMCAFSGDLSRFADAGTVVLGISCDDEISHAAFASKHHLATPLLSDIDGAVTRAYGAMGQDDKHPNRVLFAIDKQGIVRHVHKGMPDNGVLLSVIQGLT